MNFGKKLKQLRISKDISLRRLAEVIGVSAPYLSDVERGRRNPLSAEYIELVADTLKLSPGEKTALFDAAAEFRGDAVAPDVILYASKHKTISVALRKARDMKLGDEEWLKIIEDMEKQRK